MKYREISLINALLCVQVVFMHVSSPIVSGTVSGEWQHEILFCVQYLLLYTVPAFVMMAGVKLGLRAADGRRFSYLPYLWGRIRRVVLPYLFWAAVYLLYIVLFSKRAYPPDLGSALGEILRGDVAAHFYFVPLIMQFFLLAPLWVYLLKRWRGETLCTAAAIVTMCAQYIPQFLAEHGVYFPFNDTLFPSYLLYWMMGLCIGYDYERFRASLKSHRLALTIIAAVSAGAYVFVMYSQLGRGGENLPYGESVRILSSAALCAAVLALCTGAGGRRGRILAAADGISYNVYLSHCLFLFMLEDYLAGCGAAVGVGAEFALRLAAGFVPAVVLGLLWYGAKTALFRRLR